LHRAENLKRDLGVKDDVKKFYTDVIGSDIEEVLTIENFNYFLNEDDFINNKYLTAIIEERIFNGDVNNIDAHPNKEVILKIIPKLNDKEYQTLFPLLNEKKASIMISVVTKEETKDDIFAIVTLADEKLKSVGRLISNPNFEAIINLAMDALEDEKQREADFQFKRQIGIHMETKLQEQLKLLFPPEQIKCDVLSEQDGQDIVIKINNQIKYYIEVKSRWDPKSSIKMSRNQTIRSNEQKQNYALCAIDMTKYVGEDRYKIDDLNKILENIKYVTDIGNHVEHLVDVLKQTNETQEIHLDGDYRTLIPQKKIEEFGISVSQFENYLIDILKA
jgi:hypothetical protein